MKQQETTYTMPSVAGLTRVLEKLHASLNVRTQLFPLMVAELHDRTFTASELGNALYCAFGRYISRMGEEMRNTQFRYLPLVLSRLITDDEAIQLVTRQMREMSDARATQAA